MNESSGATPSPRIGDAERDRAVDCLREHHASGRLDAVEFDERMGRALEARTMDDLRPLFTDLPAPVPDGLDGSLPVPLVKSVEPTPAVAATPASRAAWLSPEVFSSLTAVAWVACIIAVAAFNAPGVIFLVPIMLMPALAGVLHSHRQAKEELERKARGNLTDGRSEPDDLR